MTPRSRVRECPLNQITVTGSRVPMVTPLCCDAVTVTVTCKYPSHVKGLPGNSSSFNTRNIHVIYTSRMMCADVNELDNVCDTCIDGYKDTGDGFLSKLPLTTDLYGLVSLPPLPSDGRTPDCARSAVVGV